MKIANEDKCSLCEEYTETLEHVYINCKFSRQFVKSLTQFININIDPLYTDDKHIYFITCYNGNKLIDYCNLVDKWFLVEVCK